MQVHKYIGNQDQTTFTKFTGIFTNTRVQYLFDNIMSSIALPKTFKAAVVEEKQGPLVIREKTLQVTGLDLV